MNKKVAVLAVNPVNGMGLFQYLEAFFEKNIQFKTFAVAESSRIKTNSGITLNLDDTINNLKGKEDEYEAVVFSCGDAIPQFNENADKQYNQDMLTVLKAFGDKNKMIIGHCAAALMFESIGIIDNKRVAIHPFGKALIQKGKATNEEIEIDSNIYTAQTENSIWKLMPEILKAFK